MQAVVPTPSNPVVNAGGGGCCAKICKECRNSTKQHVWSSDTYTPITLSMIYIWSQVTRKDDTKSRKCRRKQTNLYIYILDRQKVYLYMTTSIFIYELKWHASLMPSREKRTIEDNSKANDGHFCSPPPTTQKENHQSREYQQNLLSFVTYEVCSHLYINQTWWE